jgi:ribonuclease BN (tRNA processing enzyme)
MKITTAGFWGAFPEENSATSCYVVKSEGETFLLDCGSGAMAVLPRIANRNDIDQMIISHRHFDHTADIGAFVYSRATAMGLKETDRPLTIHAPAGEKAFFQQFEKEKISELKLYETEDRLLIGGVRLTFQKTTHPAPCWAARLEKDGKTVVYTADTVYDEALVSFSEKADLLIAECSFYENQDASAFGHMNSREAARIAEAAGVKELWLSHLPHFGEHEQLKNEAEKYFSGKIHLAAEGLSWEG